MPLRRLLLIPLAPLLVASLLLACGDDDDDDSDGTNGTDATATPTQAEGSPPAAMTPTPTEAAGDTGGAAEEVQLEIAADNNEFSTDTLTAPAGAMVILTFTNQEAVPHNVSVYQTEASEEVIFEGEIITGPDETIEYEFEAPAEPGTYFFVCDVHPEQMTGDFVVE